MWRNEGSENSGSCSTEDGLTGAFQDVTNLPLEDSNGAGLTQISKLVMLGESASNRHVNNVLKEVLGDQSKTLVATMNAGGVGHIDPLVAASRGVAQDCWDRMNFKQGVDGEYSL